jgi:hypothetical protein
MVLPTNVMSIWDTILFPLLKLTVKHSGTTEDDNCKSLPKKAQGPRRIMLHFGDSPWRSHGLNKGYI